MKKLFIITCAVLASLELTAQSQKEIPVSEYKILVQQFQIETDPFLQERIVKKMELQEPEKDLSPWYGMLAVNMIKKKNTQKAIDYFNQVDDIQRTSVLQTIVSRLIEYDLTSAEKLVLSEIAANNSQMDKGTLFLLHSQVLSKKGDYVGAIKLFKPYYDSLDKKPILLKANYYYLQSKTGGSKEALVELENAVKGGYASTEIREELKNVYTRLNPEMDGAEHLAALDKQRLDMAKHAILKDTLNEAAPNFHITDMTGKKVSLLDFKGKVMVLDFWATWCGPCKASLPAMQATYNLYKEDKDVAFLFIHTSEQVPDPVSDAKKYFKDNNYDMPLYMDLKDPVTKKNEAITLLGIRGIPAKFIIDRRGNIKFKKVGFGGLMQKTVDEMTAMIEVAKKSE